MIETKATKMNAILRLESCAIKPIKTGPPRKAAIAKVFMVASPMPGAKPLTLADAW